MFIVKMINLKLFVILIFYLKDRYVLMGVLIWLLGVIYSIIVN